ncbi:hypothetical protein FHW02_001760 [Ochrobactrum sp. RH1CCR137]|nr:MULTISPECIES: hypothetical protein [Brucella/Ochrobactrum group]MBA8843708.1 hypothetical protein [Ochrobactrum sp. RH1CCR137]MBA8856753.1 hypothetical protein [Ochrobactrum sp. RH1CCR134]
MPKLHGWHANDDLLSRRNDPHLMGADDELSVKEKTMFTRFNNRFGRAFAQFGSAVRASAAVRAGQKPTAQDLETLGIDVDQFRRIQG